MIVLIASAHYPPNFVSGGALVPQQLAGKLRGLGHDVHVFAGWRGEGREPLEEWDEVGEEGVHIHWVNSTPWLTDLDDRQFDNPQVADAFVAHMERVRPSLVNFHSIQGLGAGIVDAATARGLPTVLVMHDFWWWCGRMFMSDRNDRPCSPVVDCGVCECSISAEWLASRNKRLRASLDKVDRIVCVSHSLAKVARANGVDENLLQVIENGVPTVPDLREESAHPEFAAVADGVRFVYAGGPDPRKGPYLLADALRQMEGVSNWSLTTYGWPEDAQVPTDAPIVRRPPFSPDQVGRVLDSADVLVLPSIMRESYSILARQALNYGVPVLTSDSLGPEEVIEDGVNGLVIPSADPSALGLAMRRLAGSAGLVKALKEGRSTTAVRSMGNTSVEYEKLFIELVASRNISNPRPHCSRINRVLFVVGITGAPLRYRAYLPSEALADLGVRSDVRHYRHPDVDGLAANADILVFYRVPATVQVVNLISGVRARGTPIAFDVDDLIFDPDVEDGIPAVSILSKVEANQWMEGVRRYRATFDLCDAFIGSTAELVEHAEALTGLPSYRFPNGVGRIVAQLSDEEYRRPRSAGPVRIGYLSGTNTHDYDWQHVEPAVARIMEDFPELELWLIGLIEPTSALDHHSARIVRRPLVPWTELPGVLRDIDVNLAPLAPGWQFNRSKSAIKWLEAALVGTPTIASPTEPFREVIKHGHNGMLAETEKEWYSAIDLLVGDETTRKIFGNRSRREALLDLTPSIQGIRYLKILTSVRSNPVPASKTETWRAITDNEPSAPFEVDTYARSHIEMSISGPSTRVTMRRRFTDTRVTLREQGLAAAAARASRYGAGLMRGLARRMR